MNFLTQRRCGALPRGRRALFFISFNSTVIYSVLFFCCIWCLFGGAVKLEFGSVLFSYFVQEQLKHHGAWCALSLSEGFLCSLLWHLVFLQSDHLSFVPLFYFPAGSWIVGYTFAGKEEYEVYIYLHFFCKHMALALFLGAAADLTVKQNTCSMVILQFSIAEKKKIRYCSTLPVFLTAVNYKAI